MTVYHVPYVKVKLVLCHRSCYTFVPSQPIKSLFGAFGVCAMDFRELWQIRVVLALWIIGWHAAGFCVVDTVKFVNHKLHLIV